MNKTEIADKNLDQITGGRSLTPDNLAGISEVDLSELIKKTEDTFGVSNSAPITISASVENAE